MNHELIYTPAPDRQTVLARQVSLIESQLSDRNDICPTERERLLMQLEVLTELSTSDGAGDRIPESIDC